MTEKEKSFAEDITCKTIYEALYLTQQNIVQPKQTGEAEVITKSGAKYGYKFTPLNEVQKAVQKAMKGTGLSYVQLATKNEKGDIGIQTIIYHSSGDNIDCGTYYMPKDPSLRMSLSQAEGSIITYCKRYTLSTVFGISSEEEKPDVDQENNVNDQESYLLIKDRLTELARKTDKQYEELRGFILGKINKQKNSNFQDFEPANFSDAIGVIKTLELKQQAKNEKQPEPQNNDFDWGN